MVRAVGPQDLEIVIVKHVIGVLYACAATGAVAVAVAVAGEEAWALVASLQPGCVIQATRHC